MRKIISTLLVLVFFCLTLKAQNQNYQEIVDFLNVQNGESIYLKDFSTKLMPGEETRFSVVLSKNSIYSLTIYQPEKNNFEFKLYNKKEALIKPLTLDHKKNFEKHNYAFKNSGVYNVYVKNKSNQRAFTAIVISYVEDNTVTEEPEEEVIPITAQGSSQKEKSHVDQNDKELEIKETFFVVEEMPKFKGKGSDEFKNYVQKRLKYPQEAIDQKIEGRLFVQLTVGKTGYVKDAKVVRGIHPALDQEVLRVVYSSPKWDPGIQNERPVNVTLTFPISFKLP